MKGKEQKMPLIKITTDDPEDLFKAPEFPILPAGKHLFLVANQMEITESKSGISMLRLEARCQDEEEGKGMVVFDNFMLYASATTDNEITAKKINDAALAQFVAACEILTPEEIKAGMEFDIEKLNGSYFNAESVVRLEPIYPSELDDAGKPKKAPRASIKRYLMPEKAPITDDQASEAAAAGATA